MEQQSHYNGRVIVGKIPAWDCPEYCLLNVIDNIY